LPGETTTAALADSLSTMRSSARMVQEQKGDMRSTVDRRVLGKNIGNTWSEVDYSKLTASSVTETTDNLDSPEQVTDTLISIAPTDSGIHMVYTDRVADRILSDGASIIRSGALSMRAILRKNNLDGIVQGRSATTDMGTAGNPLTVTLVRHAGYRISSNTTEPGRTGILHMQHHGFCIADIDDELSAAVGTYEITTGVTAEVFAKSYAASPKTLSGVMVHENGDMTIDSASDSEGFVYDQDGIIQVEGRGIRTEIMRRPNLSGGSTSVFAYFEYAWGFRSSGNWTFSITADATAPA